MHPEVEGVLAEARALGFLGPGPLEAHERSADAFADVLGDLPAGRRAMDLGSGGGVPGLLLADRYPDVAWVLLDKHRRRTSFLARSVATLGWAGRVEVVRAAAEEAAHDPTHRATFSIVVSRSFGPAAIVAECAAGFLLAGGRLLVAEPPARADRWPAAPLGAVGLEVEEVGGPIAVLRQQQLAPASSPRPWRTMERKPLW